MFPLFATGVVFTDGKFVAGVSDTGDNLPPIALTLVASLPQASTTVAKLVEKFAAGAWAWRKLIHEKNKKQKSCNTALTGYWRHVTGYWHPET